MLEAREKTYTAKDFEYLLGTTHIDNEDGLEYRVVTVREHRARKVKYIVVDRELVSGNGGDTLYTLDVAAMTERVPQSAAAGPTLTAASEHTGHYAASAEGMMICSVVRRAYHTSGTVGRLAAAESLSLV